MRARWTRTPKEPPITIERRSIKRWEDAPATCPHCGGPLRHELAAARLVCIVCGRDLHIEEGPKQRPLTDAEIEGDTEATPIPAAIAARKCHCGRLTKTLAGCCTWCRYRKCDQKRQPKRTNDRLCLRCDKAFESSGAHNRLCGPCRGLEE